MCNGSKVNMNIIISSLLSLLLLGLWKPLDYIVCFFVAILVMYANMDTAIITYFIVLPWERMLSIPFIGSAMTVLQLLILIKGFSNKTSFFRVNVIQTFFILYFLAIGLYSFVVTKLISGLSICMEVLLILCMSRKLLGNKELLYQGLKYTSVSFLVSLGYSLAHGNFGRRWVDGLGYVPLFLGVLESNETAFYCTLVILFLCVLDYPLKKKLLYMVITYLALLGTVSMTGIAIASLAVVYAVFFGLLSYGKNGERLSVNRKQKMIIILATVVYIGIVVNLDIGRAVYKRAVNTLANISMGNIDKATSGREELLTAYMGVFNSLPLTTRLFGTGYMGRQYMISLGMNIQYPHNSFVELAFYAGYFGILLIAVCVINHLYNVFKSDRESGKLLFGIKLITIIEGFSVTMAGYGYWTIWLYI